MVKVLKLKEVSLKVGLVGLAALSLAACATETPYAKRGENTGYGFSEQKIESNRFRVTFRGNSSTSRETVENYILYRSAELTLENGFDYFIVVEDDTEKTTTYQSTGRDFYGYGRPFPYYGYGYGFGRRTGFNDYDIRESNRYTAIAYILMGKGDKPVGEKTAYNAAEVKANLESFIQRPEVK